MAEPKSIKHRMSFLWEVVEPFRRRALFVLVVMLIDTALASIGVGIILPVFQTMLAPESEHLWIMQIVPALSALSAENRIIIVAATTLLVFTSKFIMGLLHVGFTRDFAERMRTYWCERIGRHNLHGPYSNIVRQKQGILLNNWRNEPVHANKFFLSYMRYISSLILTLALLSLGLFVSWKITVAFIVLVGLVLFILKRRSFGVAAEHSRLKVDLNQQLSANMTESLANIKDIKILTAEPVRLQQLWTILTGLRSLFVRMALAVELPRLLGEFMVAVALVGVLAATLFIENFTIAKVLPMAAFFFVAFYKLLTSSTSAMTARMKAWQEIHSVRLVHALSQEVDEKAQQGEAVDNLSTDICFEHVTFSYEPDRSLFVDMNLVLPRGKLIFLSGKSGTGKSTLLDLLLRIYSPQEGRITANGKEISDYKLTAWRRLFGYVSQEATLFHGSIAMNVRMGLPEATNAEIEAACRLAGCHDFIAVLPDGYDTLVGERGLALSGGQRKRIAIARALVGKPSVLILDEATTSFEMDIESDIIRALRHKRPGLTMLQITHRFQSASEADLILHLEDGTIRQTTAERDDFQVTSLTSTRA